MAFDQIIITNAQSCAIAAKHQNEHPDFEYYKKVLLSGENGAELNVSLYEVPPGKSAYPYHHHFRNEEAFYIISGQGLLRTPKREYIVVAGDIMAFPPCPAGAHQLTNTSEREKLIYLAFGSHHSPEVSFMPDSGKRVIYGQGLRQIVREGESLNYYDGE